MVVIATARHGNSNSHRVRLSMRRSPKMAATAKNHHDTMPAHDAQRYRSSPTSCATRLSNPYRSSDRPTRAAITTGNRLRCPRA
jgi:hypothetical protein